MLRLILPILFPSWRFFNSIGASPRLMLQFDDNDWIEFCPKPVSINYWQRLWRVFYNPIGNKSLFVHSCAVRLFDEQDPLAIANINLALAQAISLGTLTPPAGNAQIRWRIEQLNWDTQGKIIANIIYTSNTQSIARLLANWADDLALCP
jgi:hypothetical protein